MAGMVASRGTLKVFKASIVLTELSPVKKYGQTGASGSPAAISHKMIRSCWDLPRIRQYWPRPGS